MNFKKSLPKWILKYDCDEIIRPKERGDKLLNERIFVVETSLNPFLESYFQYRFADKRRKCALNFQELFMNAKRIIFFTYLKDVNIDYGKIKIVKYNCPACFPEMEISFEVEQSFSIKVKEGDADKTLKESLFTNILIIAEQIKQLNQNNYNFSQLNNYRIMPDYEIPENIKHIMETYDNEIIRIGKVLSKGILP